MNRFLTVIITSLIGVIISGCSHVPCGWGDRCDDPCMKVVFADKGKAIPLASLSQGDPRVLEVGELCSSCKTMPEAMELLDDRDVGIAFTATVPSTSDPKVATKLKWIDVPVYITTMDNAGRVVDRRDYEFSMTIGQQETWTRQRVAYPIPSSVKMGDANYTVFVSLHPPVGKNIPAPNIESKKKHLKHAAKGKKSGKKKGKRRGSRRHHSGEDDILGDDDIGAPIDGIVVKPAKATKESLAFGMTKAG